MEWLLLSTVCDKAFDPSLCGGVGDSGKQNRSEAFALMRVDNRNCNLCLIGLLIQPDAAGNANRVRVFMCEIECADSDVIDLID